MPSLADEVEYTIHGSDTQFVEIELDPNESIIAEAGSMLYMEDNINMNTILGDGSHKEDRSILSTIFGAGKRLISGEGMFMTSFTNQGNKKRKLSFAAPYPGKIMPIDLLKHGGVMICQKDAFLCAAKGVSVGLSFQKNIMTGIFGGEGFILQKLQGDGLAFVHAGGTIFEKTLVEGESLRIDSGCVVAFQPTISFDIHMIKNVKSALFGGEGLFLAHLKGPGKVWVQSMPFSRLSAQIASRINFKNNKK